MKIKRKTFESHLSKCDEKTKEFFLGIDREKMEYFSNPGDHSVTLIVIEPEYSLEFTVRENGHHLNIVYLTTEDTDTNRDPNNDKPQVLVRVNIDTKEITVSPYQDYDVEILEKFSEHLCEICDKKEETVC